MMAWDTRNAVRGSSAVTLTLMRFVSSMREAEMVPSKESAPISARMFLRRRLLLSSSSKIPARVEVEERLLYTEEELPRAVTT